jgi:hypothetical protein
MKIFLISFLLSAFSMCAFSQERQLFSIDLQWNKKSIIASKDNKTYKTIPFFDGAHIGGSHHDLPFHLLKFDLITNGKLSVKLENIETEIIENVNIDSEIESEYQIFSFVDQIRDLYQGGIRLTPIRKVDHSFERIIKADLVVHISYDLSENKRGPERTFNSILSDGKIYKLAVPEAGVYALDQTALAGFGIDISTIDPRNISIYSNLGGMLPERIADQNADDLIELPIIIKGEEDGSFDSNDRIIFYMEGPDKWLAANNTFTYEKNIYDVKNYAYLKINNTSGKRISKSSNSPNPGKIQSSYSDFQVYHEDQVNLLALNASSEGSGKLWFGKRFSGSESLNLSPFFNLENLDEQLIKVEGRFASRSESSTSTSLQIGSESFERTYNPVNVESIQSDYANLRTFSASAEIDQSKNFNLTYNGNSESKGWLDYIMVRCQKKFSGISETTFIRSTNDHLYDSYGYNVDGVKNGYRFLDVTDIQNIIELNAENGIISYTTNTENHTLVSFEENTLQTPELIGEIKNQNIHGITDVDMIVLYPEEFKEAADKFITHRSSHSNLEVIGLDVKSIYPEFSSGRQDPTAIRDFAKMLYDRNNRFKYMLFIGDGSYDQRRINKNIPDHRFIPVYETDRSLNPISSFPTDDYFALLSDNEGVSLDGGLDIAVGRLTVTTLEEANAVINKIIQYDTSPSRFGDWRLKGTFTADDEDTGTHLNQIEGIADYVNEDFPIINDQKIYLDAYRQETTPGGERYPEVEDAFSNAMDRGHLTFCYLGHGGPKGWAQERVLKVPDIQAWDNINNQTLIITATCSFTGYDDPEIKSAGEHALLNPKGGTVALFTTVREVYANDNERLTRAVFENIYKRVDGLPPTFGDIITKAKNTNKQDTLGENSRKFALIGDPSQKIAIPMHDITVDEINGIPVSEFTDTIGALQKVVVSGSVLDYEGNLLNNFNGKIYPTVFDKRTIIETLKNDPASTRTKIDILKNIIFKGIATIENGMYTFSFIVPKDINYSIGNGKISLYATDGVTQDAAGSFSELKIGGSSENFADDQGPEIELYINEDSFESGDEVLPNSTLLVYLNDDLGINVTGTGIGHDLTAELEGPIEAYYILNEFYEASLDNYTSGIVRFPLENLPPGDYSIKVKAWDISNNSNDASIAFTVVENKEKKLFNVTNYPNPFTDNTTISFLHDLGSAQANISVDIFTLSGQLVHKIKYSTILSGNIEIIQTEKNGVNLNDILTSGLYVYKIKVEAPALGTNRESSYYKMVKI